MKILACIDSSPTAGPVLETTLVLARLLHAQSEAIHVRMDESKAAIQAAFDAGLPIRIIHARPIEELVTELDSPDVILAVIGARRSTKDPRPAGLVASAIAEAAAKPVVVVPPDAVLCRPGEFRRVLVPLDGTEETMLAAKHALNVLDGAALEVVVLHVFDTRTTPLFLDRPEYDLDAWTKEFLARAPLAPRARFTLRSGRAGAEIVRVADEEDVHLVTLAWSQDMSEGHAGVVREVLAHASVPVLLLPVKPASPPEGGRPALSAARVPHGV